MKESTVYIGVGSNLGDRVDNCNKATELLAGIGEVKVVSPLYDTAPRGLLDQPRFLNGAVEVTTTLSPEDFLLELKSIERRMGRVLGSEKRYGPRIIDLDILFFGRLVIDKEGLHIPHPLMHERAFVLRPLSDIAPSVIHPVLKRSVGELLAALPAGEKEDLDFKSSS